VTAQALPSPPPPLAQRARELSLTLTGWPSVTGTKEEADFAERLAGLLRQLPYFEQNPDDLIVAPLPGDPLNRANVLALVRGEGPQTVILSGHFDTVPTEDYGELQPWAGAPDELLPRLIARLEQTGADPQALADFRSGEFLPGRGLLDMKSGVAAGLAVLEAFAADPSRTGNLLLVATPDEEESSAGMRAVADLLPGWLGERDLEVRLAINLDAICDEGDGSSGRVVAFGCIGKLLLSALVIGLESHAAYPLAGVNAAYLAAELTSELEFAPELGEEAGGELAAPPTVLGSRDLKSQYNVTIPGAVWSYWNVLLQRRKATQVLETAKELALRAMTRAAARMAERVVKLQAPVAQTPAWIGIPVMTFAQVYETARKRSPEFGARFDERAERLREQPDLDLPTRSRHLMEETWKASGLQGPAVVLAFGSMPYPAVPWPQHADKLRGSIVEAARETELALGVSIGSVEYFPAIADMSFIGPIDEPDLAEAARQTPLWGSSIRWDLSDRATPGIPIVNIGPWGRDYHHWLERVHAPYAFEVLPVLLQTVARRVLDPDRPASQNLNAQDLGSQDLGSQDLGSQDLNSQGLNSQDLEAQDSAPPASDAEPSHFEPSDSESEDRGIFR
jgi:arginine utilization protein RocB